MTVDPDLGLNPRVWRLRDEMGRTWGDEHGEDGERQGDDRYSGKDRAQTQAHLSLQGADAASHQTTIDFVERDQSPATESAELLNAASPKPITSATP
jgi:hypothetical protein